LRSSTSKQMRIKHLCPQSVAMDFVSKEIPATKHGVAAFRKATALV